MPISSVNLNRVQLEPVNQVISRKPGFRANDLERTPGNDSFVTEKKKDNTKAYLIGIGAAVALVGGIIAGRKGYLGESIQKFLGGAKDAAKSKPKPDVKPEVKPDKKDTKPLETIQKRKDGSVFKKIVKDENGKLVEVTRYGKDGKTVTMSKKYKGGKLDTAEYFNEEGKKILEKESDGIGNKFNIIRRPEGKPIRVSSFENGKMLKDKYYAPDGTTKLKIVNKDADGNITKIRHYNQDKTNSLKYTREYIYNGAEKPVLRTTRHGEGASKQVYERQPDGTTTFSRYNFNGKMTSKTVKNADGKVVEKFKYGKNERVRHQYIDKDGYTRYDNHYRKNDMDHVQKLYISPKFRRIEVLDSEGKVIGKVNSKQSEYNYPDGQISLLSYGQDGKRKAKAYYNPGESSPSTIREYAPTGDAAKETTYFKGVKVESEFIPGKVPVIFNTSKRTVTNPKNGEVISYTRRYKAGPFKKLEFDIGHESGKKYLGYTRNDGLGSVIGIDNMGQILKEDSDIKKQIFEYLNEIKDTETLKIFNQWFAPKGQTSLF